MTDERKKAPESAPMVWDVMNPKCPTQQVLDRVASKWTMLVILALGEQPQRYAQLQRRIGRVTKKVLTQTLRALERDGLLHRHVYDTVPVQTEYELSDRGRSLAAAVAVIRAWAYENVQGVQESRGAFDGRRRQPERLVRPVSGHSMPNVLLDVP